MYRRNDKSILLLRRTLSEQLRLGQASSASPPLVLRQVLPASSSYARLATGRPKTNKRKQCKGHFQVKDPKSATVKLFGTQRLKLYLFENTQMPQQPIGKSRPLHPSQTGEVTFTRPSIPS